MLGGSIYAVATAVRLSRAGYKVTLIHKGRRLGSFPFTLLSKEYLAELGVDASLHSEEETSTFYVDGQIVKIPTTLYLCRTTPLLEETLAYNEIEFNYKFPKSVDREIIDCEPRPWENLRLFQAVVVKGQRSDSFLEVGGVKGLYLSVTFHGGRLAVDYRYSTRLLGKHSNAIAFIERPIAYPTLANNRLFPAASLAGQDMAEIIDDAEVLNRNTATVLEFLKGVGRTSLKDCFASLFL